MKKILLVIVSVMMIVTSTAALAEVKATLGVKSWYNWWEHTVDYSDGTSDSWDNGSSFMIGPSFNLKLGKAFLGASYLKSTSDYEAPDWNTNGDMMQFERKDLDATVGVMFVPYFGIFLGYKSIEAPMSYTNQFGVRDSTKDETWKINGPGIGILANAPLGRSAAIYGNLAFLDLEQEFESATGISSSSFDMVGVSFELGAAFAFSRVVSSNVGFKYQTLSGDSAAGNTHHQNFYGLTLGVNFTF